MVTTSSSHDLHSHVTNRAQVEAVKRTWLVIVRPTTINISHLPPAVLPPSVIGIETLPPAIIPPQVTDINSLPAELNLMILESCRYPEYLKLRQTSTRFREAKTNMMTVRFNSEASEEDPWPNRSSYPCYELRPVPTLLSLHRRRNPRTQVPGRKSSHYSGLLAVRRHGAYLSTWRPPCPSTQSASCLQGLRAIV